MPPVVSKFRFGLLLAVVIGCGSRETRPIAETAAPTASAASADSGSAPEPQKSQSTTPRVTPRFTGPTQGAPPSDSGVAFVGNPFEGAERLDPKDLSGSATAFVGVVREIDGRSSSVRPGYVFAGDEKRSYIVTEDSRAGMSSAKDPSKPLTFAYRALVGWGPDLRSVQLEEVRRYVQPNCLVLAAPKSELPEPLPVTVGEVPSPGRRMRIIGHPFWQSFDSSREPQFSRIVEPAEVIVLPEALEKIRRRGKPSSTFAIACARKRRCKRAWYSMNGNCPSRSQSQRRTPNQILPPNFRSSLLASPSPGCASSPVRT